MNRALGWFNLFGVLALATVCVGQWQINRRLNLQVIDLEKARFEHTTALAEKERSLQGSQSDLERFREQLTTATRLAKEAQEKLKDLERQLSSLTAERDQLKSSLTHWTDAVKARDQRLAEAEAQILRLAEERNSVVGRFNDLATKYEQAIAELNAARAGAAPSAANSKP